jgi:hypothetical protein
MSPAGATPLAHIDHEADEELATLSKARSATRRA